jgi:vitamin B12 transporter
VNNTTQDYFSTGPFGPYTQPTLHASMSQLSPYTLLTFHDGEGLRAEIGGRWNIHSVYGSNFSYSFNPSYTIGKARLFANLYSAFKTPTLYQLYDPYAGNKNLNPEKSKVMEVGASFDVNKKFWIRGVGFWRNTHDAINFILVDPINFQSQYTNVSRQKNDGFELEAKYQAGKLGISADYAFTEGETFSAYDATGAPLSKDTSYNNLYHVPKHAVHARVGYQVSKQFYASAQGRYVGKKYEAVYGAAPIVLPSYLVIDLYAEYKFDRRLLFFTDLKNITDKKYFDIAGYNSKRMNFVVGVRVEM